MFNSIVLICALGFQREEQRSSVRVVADFYSLIFRFYTRLFYVYILSLYHLNCYFLYIVLATLVFLIVKFPMSFGLLLCDNLNRLLYIALIPVQEFSDLIEK